MPARNGQSMALSYSDLKNVITIGHQALQHRQLDALCADLLPRISRSFDSTGAMLVMTNKPSHLPEYDPDFNYCLFRLSDHYVNEYVAAYVDDEKDPVTVEALRTGRKAFTFTQILPVETYQNSPIYIDFLKPQSLGYGLVVNFRSQVAGYLGTMTLFRHQRDPDFTLGDNEKATLMAPFLTAALERVHCHRQNQRHTQKLDGLGLTPREIEVLNLVARGLRNKDIAATLGISVNTVETHIKSLFRKCSVSNRTSLARFSTHLDDLPNLKSH